MTSLPVLLRSLFFALVLTSFSLAGCSSSPAPTNPFEVDLEAWTPLFNGQNLERWTPKITGYAVGTNKGETFRIEDGILTVRYDEYDQFDGQFGHLFYHKSFSHYAIAVE
jgi:hypothetical protein